MITNLDLKPYSWRDGLVSNFSTELAGRVARENQSEAVSSKLLVLNKELESLQELEGNDICASLPLTPKKSYSEVACIPVRSPACVAVQYLPENKIIYASIRGIHVYDRIKTEEHMLVQDSVACMHYAPNGKIFYADSTGKVSVTKLDWNRPKLIADLPARVNTIQGLPNGTLICGTSAGYAVMLHEAEPEKKSYFIGLDKQITHIKVCGESFATGDSLGRVKVWTNGENGMWERKLIHYFKEGPVSSLDYIANGNLAASSGRDFIRSKIDLNGVRSTAAGSYETEPTCMRCTLDGRTFIGFEGGWIEVSHENPKDCEYLEGHKAPVKAIQALRDGRIVSIDKTSAIRIWDGKTE